MAAEYSFTEKRSGGGTTWFKGDDRKSGGGSSSSKQIWTYNGVEYKTEEEATKVAQADVAQNIYEFSTEKQKKELETKYGSGYVRDTGKTEAYGGELLQYATSAPVAQPAQRVTAKLPEVKGDLWSFNAGGAVMSISSRGAWLEQQLPVERAKTELLYSSINAPSIQIQERRTGIYGAVDWIGSGVEKYGGGSKAEQSYKATSGFILTGAKQGTTSPFEYRQAEQNMLNAPKPSVKELTIGAAGTGAMAGLYFAKGVKTTTVDFGVSLVTHPVKTVTSLPAGMVGWVTSAPGRVTKNPLTAFEIGGEAYGGKVAGDVGWKVAKPGLIKLGTTTEAMFRSNKGMIGGRPAKVRAGSFTLAERSKVARGQAYNRNTFFDKGEAGFRLNNAALKENFVSERTVRIKTSGPAKVSDRGFAPDRAQLTSQDRGLASSEQSSWREKGTDMVKIRTADSGSQSLSPYRQRMRDVDTFLSGGNSKMQGTLVAQYTARDLVQIFVKREVRPSQEPNFGNYGKEKNAMQQPVVEKVFKTGQVKWQGQAAQTSRGGWRPGMYSRYLARTELSTKTADLAGGQSVTAVLSGKRMQPQIGYFEETQAPVFAPQNKYLREFFKAPQEMRNPLGTSDRQANRLAGAEAFKLSDRSKILDAQYRILEGEQRIRVKQKLLLTQFERAPSQRVSPLIATRFDIGFDTSYKQGYRQSQALRIAEVTGFEFPRPAEYPTPTIRPRDRIPPDEIPPRIIEPGIDIIPRITPPPPKKPPPPDIVEPPPIIPITGLMQKPYFDESFGRKRRKGTKVKTKYNPSVEAVVFNIKQPKFNTKRMLSGLEVRPMLR